MQPSDPEVSSSETSPIPDSAPIQRACFVVAVVAMVGYAFTSVFAAAGLNRTDGPSGNVFYYLFCANEPIHLLTLILASLLCFFWFRSTPLTSKNRVNPEVRPFRWVPVLLSAAGVLVIASVGARWVFHSFPLSMDEYMADFQARIFAAGKMKSTIPVPLREYAYALTPIFATYNPQEHTWIAGYLPVYATIRAGLAVAGIESLTNPLLAAVSMVAIAGVGRQLWPGGMTETWVSILTLATSTQFLITSMTGYSMAAHLCLNLIWLWLYVRADRVSLLLVPWVGVLALGLHNPVVHSLFAAPFLVRLLRKKRVRLLLYFGVVYLIGLVSWLWWLQIATNGIVSVPGDRATLASFFSAPGLPQLMDQIANFVLLVSWQPFAAAVLCILALKNWSSLSPLFRDLAAGCVLTFLFYFCFKLNQGHGWGYRYCYGVLGNLALIAGAGWSHLVQLAGWRKASNFVLAASCFALVWQLPFRAIQAERFVRPFAESMKYLEASRSSFVVVDHESVWYAQDLVRNEPFLNADPKFLFAGRLGDQGSENLRSKGIVHSVAVEELVSLGMFPRGPKPVQTRQ